MDDYEADEIVICGLCQVGVHQSCYGSELVDNTQASLEDEWYCARCRELLQHPDSPVELVSCYFCPSVQGALKTVQFDNDVRIWAHISCVNWLVGMWFEDEEKEHVVGRLSGGMNDTKSKKKCSYCSIGGGLFSCDHYKCTRKYHVRCAVKLGIIYSYDQMNKDYST